MGSDDKGFEALATESAKAFARRKTPPPARPVLGSKKPPFRVPVAGIVQHVLFLGGLATVTYGCFMIYAPLGPIVGGAIVVSLSLLLSTDTQ